MNVSSTRNLNEELYIEYRFDEIDKSIKNDIRGGIESGENLDLKSWYYKTIKLSLGTEDEELLYNNRAYHGLI